MEKIINKKIKNRTALNVIIILTVVLIFAIALVYLGPIMKNIATEEGRLAFKAKIENSGIWGLLMIFALEVAQIFLVIIPGEPLEILAGMCYGSIGGAIFITASVFVTTTIIVLLVRKYGRKFVYESFNEEKVKKIENSKLLRNPQKVELAMIILFLLPGTPKDLLSYIGGLLPIKPSRFILISTFARFPSVISSTVAGAHIVSGNIKVSLIAYGITFILTAIILILVNVFDKDKETQNTIKALK